MSVAARTKTVAFKRVPIAGVSLDRATESGNGPLEWARTTIKDEHAIEHARAKMELPHQYRELAWGADRAAQRAHRPVAVCRNCRHVPVASPPRAQIYPTDQLRVRHYSNRPDPIEFNEFTKRNCRH